MAISVRASDSLLTHLRGDGTAHQVDVSDKKITKRTARAEATILVGEL